MFSFCYSNETTRSGILRAAYSKEKAIETRKKSSFASSEYKTWQIFYDLPVVGLGFTNTGGNFFFISSHLTSNPVLSVWRLRVAKSARWNFILPIGWQVVIRRNIRYCVPVQSQKRVQLLFYCFWPKKYRRIQIRNFLLIPWKWLDMTLVWRSSTDL